MPNGKLSAQLQQIEIQPTRTERRLFTKVSSVPTDEQIRSDLISKNIALINARIEELRRLEDSNRRRGGSSITSNYWRKQRSVLEKEGMKYIRDGYTYSSVREYARLRAKKGEAQARSREALRLETKSLTKEGFTPESIEQFQEARSKGKVDSSKLLEQKPTIDIKKPFKQVEVSPLIETGMSIDPSLIEKPFIYGEPQPDPFKTRPTTEKFFVEGKPKAFITQETPTGREVTVQLEKPLELVQAPVSDIGGYIGDVPISKGVAELYGTGKVSLASRVEQLNQAAAQSLGIPLSILLQTKSGRAALNLKRKELKEQFDPNVKTLPFIKPMSKDWRKGKIGGLVVSGENFYKNIDKYILETPERTYSKLTPELKEELKPLAETEFMKSQDFDKIYSGIPEIIKQPIRTTLASEFIAAKIPSYLLEQYYKPAYEIEGGIKKFAVGITPKKARKIIWGETPLETKEKQAKIIEDIDKTMYNLRKTEEKIYGKDATELIYDPFTTTALKGVETGFLLYGAGKTAVGIGKYLKRGKPAKLVGLVVKEEGKPFIQADVLRKEVPKFGRGAPFKETIPDVSKIAAMKGRTTPEAIEYIWKTGWKQPKITTTGVTSAELKAVGGKGLLTVEQSLQVPYVKPRIPILRPSKEIYFKDIFTTSEKVVKLPSRAAGVERVFSEVDQSIFETVKYTDDIYKVIGEQQKAIGLKGTTPKIKKRLSVGRDISLYEIPKGVSPEDAISQFNKITLQQADDIMKTAPVVTGQIEQTTDITKLVKEGKELTTIRGTQRGVSGVAVKVKGKPTKIIPVEFDIRVANEITKNIADDVDDIFRIPAKGKKGKGVTSVSKTAEIEAQQLKQIAKDIEIAKAQAESIGGILGTSVETARTTQPVTKVISKAISVPATTASYKTAEKIFEGIKQRVTPISKQKGKEKLREDEIGRTIQDDVLKQILKEEERSKIVQKLKQKTKSIQKQKQKSIQRTSFLDFNIPIITEPYLPKTPKFPIIPPLPDLDLKPKRKVKGKKKRSKVEDILGYSADLTAAAFKDPAIELTEKEFEKLLRSPKTGLEVRRPIKIVKKKKKKVSKRRKKR